MILKTQQRFKSERHDVFTEEINKIALSSNDDKRMQSIDSTETYPYGTSKNLQSWSEYFGNLKCFSCTGFLYFVPNILPTIV